MADETNRESRERREARQRWKEELQAALDRTGSSARTAWEATRENRVSALESAKQAAKELGEILEKGMEAARDRWDTERGEATQEETDTSPAEETPPSTSQPPPPGTDPAQSDHASSPEEPERP